MSATRTIRAFLLVEAASFAAASGVHHGLFVSGYQHEQAGIAEGLIAVVLAAGLILTWIGPLPPRSIGLAAQGLALAGTLVGLFTIAIGVGPRTVPDLAYHATIVAVLVWGLVVTARAPAGAAEAPRLAR